MDSGKGAGFGRQSEEAVGIEVVHAGDPGDDRQVHPGSLSVGPWALGLGGFRDLKL